MTRLCGCALLAFAACYRPAAEPTCAISCTTSCPDGLVCGSDGRCHAPGSPTCKDVVSDGGKDLDTPTGNEICAGSGFLALCYDVTAPYEVLTTTPLNTDDNSHCTFVHNDARRELCVVAGSNIRISAAITATGLRPLVLWSASTIDITAAGIVDVSSFSTTRQGAGGNAFDCPADIDGIDATTITNGGGGGGGAGASFAVPGGNGGGSPSVPSQPAKQALPLDSFRGGCRGGSGGAHDAFNGGTGGFGGGGVYLVAATAIVLEGKINASGGGASMASISAGGGGGGSGGMIVLDAPMTTFNGASLLMSVGGGGGTGGDVEMPGLAGTNATYAQYALATNGPGIAGDGGAGSNPINATAGSVGGMAAEQNGGGGGGGGGAGLVLVYGTIVGMPFDARPPITPGD